MLARPVAADHFDTAAIESRRGELSGGCLTVEIDDDAERAGPPLVMVRGLSPTIEVVGAGEPQVSRDQFRRGQSGRRCRLILPVRRVAACHPLRDNLGVLLPALRGTVGTEVDFTAVQVDDSLPGGAVQAIGRNAIPLRHVGLSIVGQSARLRNMCQAGREYGFPVGKPQTGTERAMGLEPTTSSLGRPQPIPTTNRIPARRRSPDLLYPHGV